LEDGSLLRSSSGSIEKLDWEGNLIWYYEDEYMHHDIEPLPNGNILYITSEVLTPERVIQLGRRSDQVEGQFFADKIVEVKPLGFDSVSVVWEWRFIDHLIQELDPALPNFGVVAEHPELIDINFSLEGIFDDWLHCNSIDYNEALDQIMICSRNSSEIYIVDHSTTTLQASGHTGGNSGRGGDLLFRWGNPAVYGRGSLTDQKLFGPHDPKWVPSGYPFENSISVFNNGLGRTDGAYSSIHLINPLCGTDGYQMEESLTFSPSDFSWTFDSSVLGEPFYSATESGVQVQPNGNFLVCEANTGRFFEVDSFGTVVWVYRNPVSHFVLDQYETYPYILNNFRAERYAENYPGLAGKELEPNRTIEDENFMSEQCSQMIDVQEYYGGANIAEPDCFPNPVSDVLFFRTNQFNRMRITDLTGKWFKWITNYNHNSVDLSFLNSGLYFLEFHRNDVTEVVKIVKL
jgi:hypothetical protein